MSCIEQKYIKGTSFMQAMEKSKMSTDGGPRRRAKTLGWLCFEEGYVSEAVQMAVSLCREFALGGSIGVDAGLYLLKEVIPTCTNCNTSMVFLERAEMAGFVTEARELLSWEEYFEIIREFSAWEEVYGSAVQEVLESGEDPLDVLQELGKETRPLYDAIVSFLSSNDVQWISDSIGKKSMPTNVDQAGVRIIIGQEETQGPYESGSTGLYPVWDESERNTIIESLKSYCERALNESGMFYEVSEAPDESSEHFPGLVSLTIWQEPSPAQEISTLSEVSVPVLCSILKHGIDTDQKTSVSLIATNILAHPSVSAAICRCICLPRLVLQVAALREALAYMGHNHNFEDSNKLIDSAHQAWSTMFSSKEMKDLDSCYKSGTSLLHDRFMPIE